MPTIDKITLENFKAFGTRQEIPLRKLTLVFGPNSSGKSSIAHALAFLHYVTETGDCNPSRIFIPDCHLDFGGLANLVRRDRQDAPARIELSFGGEHPTSCSWSFRLADPKPVIESKEWVEHTMAGALRHPYLMGKPVIDLDNPLFEEIKSEAANKCKGTPFEVVRQRFDQVFEEWKRQRLSQQNRPHPDDGPRAPGWLPSTFYDPPLGDAMPLFHGPRVITEEWTSRDVSLCKKQLVENLAQCLIKARLRLLEELFALSPPDPVEDYLYRSYLALTRFGPASPFERLGSSTSLPEFTDQAGDALQRFYLRLKRSDFHQRFLEPKCYYDSFMEETIEPSYEREVVRWTLDIDIDAYLANPLMTLPQPISERAFVKLLRDLCPEKAPTWDRFFYADPIIDLLCSGRVMPTEESENALAANVWERFWDILCYSRLDEFYADWDEKLGLKAFFGSYRHISSFRPPPPRSLRLATMQAERSRNPSWETWIRLLENASARDLASQWLKALTKHTLHVIPVKEERPGSIVDSDIRVENRDQELAIADGQGLLYSHLDLGSGITPLIPVLATLATSDDGLVFIEEPEQHLHPKLQVRLGDVLLQAAFSSNSQQIIVETHSEHLILRILRRIRETTAGEMDKWSKESEELKQACPNGIRPEDVSVLYVQPGPDGSEVIELPVTPDGGFSRPWPGGFFEDQLNELA